MKIYLIILIALFMGCGKLHKECKLEKETVGDCETNPKGICITTTKEVCEEVDFDDALNVMGI